MNRKIEICLLAGWVLLAAAGALAGPGGSVRGGDRDRVPVISAKDFDLAKLRGKVVLVGFWQSKCEQCEAYVGWLADMQTRYQDQGLVVVAVSQDPKSSSASDLLNKIHPRTQVVLDPTGKMAARYELDAMPATYLHDRNLELRDGFPGFDPKQAGPLEEVLLGLLEEKIED